MLRRALALTGFLLLAATRLHAFNEHQPFDISADMIDYVDGDQSMTADGHVVVIQGTSTLKADHMRYERLDKRLLAQGHVLLDDNGGVMLGDALDYDLAQQKGFMTNALGFQKPWLFTAESWDKHFDYYVGREASFTSCDLVDPHYHIRSSRVHLVPGDHFWAWNNVGYADTLPVFYSPFIYKNLAKQKVVVQFQPGHDDVNGNFVKTQTTLRLTDQVYDKVLYDHYSQQGNGVGDEFDYQVPGKVQGSLFGYFINPHGGDASLAGAPTGRQYNIRAYHWERIDPTLTLQSNVNLRDNVSFNNQYFPQDTNQSVNSITSSIALTKAKGLFNQQLVVQSQNAPDATDISTFPATHIQTASVPQYNITMYQFPLWKPKSMRNVSSSSSSFTTGMSSGSMSNISSSSNSFTTGISSGPMSPGTTMQVFRPLTPYKPQTFGPLMLSGNGNLGETYQRLDGLYHANGNSSLTLNDAIRISRDWSFNPSITPQLSWQDKFNAQPPPPVGSTTPVSTVGLIRGYQGRLGTSDNLRWRPFSSLTFDQTYALTARMEPNGTALDRAPTDGGIETNHLSWVAFMRPSRKMLLRSFSGYDLRKIADEDPNTYLQRRIDPWTTEITVDPNSKNEYFFRYALGYYPTRAELWEADYTFKGLYKTLLQTGLLYNNGTPGLLTWNNQVGIFASPGWRVDATIHTFVSNSTVASALHNGSLIDEEFIVTRDLHCWQAQFVYRNIPPLSRQYSLLFNLKIGVAAEQQITNNDLESQYYPWRSRTYAP
jgi:hypothetical protein